MVNTLKVAKIFCVLLLISLSAQLSLAQESWDSAPLPAPTNAVEDGLKTLTVEIQVPARQGEIQSLKAATLLAQGQLLEACLESKVFLGGWQTVLSGPNQYRIGEDFGNAEQLSWLMQSQQIETSIDKKVRTVVLESANKSSVQLSRHNLRSLSPTTIDGKQVAVGFDGSVYVLQPQNDGSSKVLFQSACYGSFESLSSEGYQRYYSRVPLHIQSVAKSGDDMVKVELISEITEVVNGELMGHAQQSQLIFVPTKRTSDITFSELEPVDFSRQSTDPMPLKGKVQSRLLLDSLELQHNGVQVWAVPENMRQKLSSLDFQLTRPLSQGWSLLRFSARDVEGALQNRDLWVYSPQGSSAISSGLKRALLVTSNERSWPKPLLGQLRKNGYQDAMVTVLDPKKTTAQEFLANLGDGRSASHLFLYVEATVLSAPGVDGKKLQFSDRSLSPTEISQALNAGGYKNVLGLLQMSSDRNSGKEDGSDWLEKTIFLERLADGGRLFATLLDSSSRRSRNERELSRELIQAALESNQGDVLLDWLSNREADRLLLRGWLFGKF